MVWDLDSFKSSDLRTCASHKHQKVGEPLVVGRCELPVTGGITFPLKSHYDTVNSDIFNPMLIEPDPEDGEESDEEAIKARAPPDLDARLPLENLPAGGAETPQVSPHPSGREDALDREDGLPREAIPPSTPEAEEKEDSLPREAMPPPPPDPDLSKDPTKITDEKWNKAFKWWCRHISSEEPKQERS